VTRHYALERIATIFSAVDLASEVDQATRATRCHIGALCYVISSDVEEE